MFGGTALREHMKDCMRDRAETRKEIQEVRKEMQEGFTAVRHDSEKRYDKVQENFDKLYNAILWKLAVPIIGFVIATYLATHGLPELHLK